MTGRFVWLAAGIGIGVAAGRRIERSGPAATVEAAAGRVVRRARHALDAVVEDGRVEMHRREARLRAVLATPDRAGRGVTRGER